MTRDECLKAVSGAFNGAYAWATIGSWAITIEAVPERTLVMSAAWVAENIQPVGERARGMSADQLQAQVQSMGANQWTCDAKGNLFAMLRHNGQ
ncbi:hypothetical protein [Duganella vulcania]|uniref:Uncharacterized protein n=1 Tax=Duganella vulcania TaxID=2692166 RepID=A0A845GE19_9BURK|nr:hypothetical protein [Duganella vulcania]MYM92534.1 hypothetical protein [Duganella vulcania]